MNKKKQLAKNTLIIAFGKLSTQLIAFFLLPLYTIFLTPGEYGTVDLITSYTLLFVPAITLQMEMALFRFLVDVRNDEAGKKQVISNVLQLVTAIVGIGSIAYILLNEFINIPYAMLILLNVFALIFINLSLQIARGLGDNMKFAIACILGAVTTLASTLIFVVILKWGIEGMLLVQATANFISVMYLFFALRLHNYIGTKRNATLQKELIRYSFPLVPNGVSWWAINASGRAIISVTLGVAANGIYAVANKYSAICGSIFGVFAMSWTEAASMHIDSKDRDKFFSEIANASIRVFGSFILVLIALLAIVFPLLTDNRFHEAYLYTPILILAAFFNAVVNLYSAIYIAKKMTKQVASTTLVAGGVNILLTLGLLSWFGLYGATIATAISFFIMAVYRHYDIKKYITITYNRGLFIKLAAALMITSGLYYLNKPISNIGNILFTFAIAAAWNKAILTLGKDKILSLSSHRRKPTPDQEVYEDTLQR